MMVCYEKKRNQKEEDKKISMEAHLFSLSFFPQVDKAIEFSSVPFALVRVQAPMHLLADLAAGIKTNGHFGLPIKESVPLAWVDPRDLVQCLARLVSSVWKSIRILFFCVSSLL